MSTLVEHRGHSITIGPEEDGESPLSWGDPVKLFHWHKRGFCGQRTDNDPRAQDLQSSGAYLAPLYLYEHSGQTVSLAPFRDPWDSGQVGFLYVEPEAGRKEFGRHWRVGAKKAVESMVEILDQYLRGDVWYYSVDGHLCQDSCGDIYGYDEAVKQAKEAIDADIEREERESKACQRVLAL